ncbi:MAG: toprim domain-containing protein [Proteobacteria bacterium]|nr:toprim domain-containing protein [Pseudomonadota bacterium]
MNRIDPARLEAVRAGIAEIATEILGRPTSQNGSGLRYRRRGSLAIDTEKCLFFDHEAGEGGDAINLIRREYNIGFLAAVVVGEELLGLDGNIHGPAYQKPKRRPIATKAAMPKPKGINAEALNAWNSALPLGGSVAVAYFEEIRHCGIPGHHCCRFIPSLRHHKSGRNFPCIVSLLTDAVNGGSLSLHMTFLAHDGRGKAPVERPRLFWYGPPIGGGVSRLSPDDQVETGLVISEGLEDGQSLLDYGLAPVWACMSAGLMAKLPVLAGIEALTICADADANDAGRRAATECKDRWTAAGREVTITYPRGIAKDFNEVAVARAGS